MAFLVDDILLAPVKMVKWLGEKLSETAEEEITDESKVYGQILELQMRYEMDEVMEAEYEKEETRLMAKLEAIRRYKEDGASPNNRGNQYGRTSRISRTERAV
ncbi:MAG: gas vesicle protein GvpG [Candidatus Binatia bacterium]